MKNEFAFPRIVPEGDQLQPGLTKLEWFAGMALKGFLSSQNTGFTDHKQMERNAEEAFTQAEYMINESAKSNP